MALHAVLKPRGTTNRQLEPHKLDHRHVLKVIDSWEDNDKIYYVTEILTAGTLEG